MSRRKSRLKLENISSDDNDRRIKDIKNLSPKTVSYRRTDKELYRNKYWNDCLYGEPAFILGNGTSLNEIPLSALDGFLTIGINRIFYVYDPTILIWQDRGLWAEHAEKIKRLKAIRYARDKADPECFACQFKLKGRLDPDFPRDSGLLYGFGTTGILAIQLAYILGCRKMILTGMDCKNGEDGESDFYGDNVHHTTNTMRNCKRGLTWIRKREKAGDIDVINCSNNGVWKKENFAKVVDGFKSGSKNRSYYKRMIYNARSKHGN